MRRAEPRRTYNKVKYELTLSGVDSVLEEGLDVGLREPVPSQHFVEEPEVGQAGRCSCRIPCRFPAADEHGHVTHLEETTPRA